MKEQTEAAGTAGTAQASSGTQSSSVPYLKSERHFRRYEYYIEQIVNNWPAVQQFKPRAPVASVETLTSRIRICLLAYEQSLADGGPAWKVRFSTAKFLEIVDNIVVSPTVQPGYVVCGPRDLVRKQVPLGVQVEPAVEQMNVPKVNLVDPPLELIQAVIVCHHHRLFTEPSVVQTTQNFSAFAERHDVAVEREGDVYTIL